MKWKHQVMIRITIVSLISQEINEPGNQKPTHLKYFTKILDQEKLSMKTKI